MRSKINEHESKKTRSKQDWTKLSEASASFVFANWESCSQLTFFLYLLIFCSHVFHLLACSCSRFQCVVLQCFEFFVSFSQYFSSLIINTLRSAIYIIRWEALQLDGNILASCYAQIRIVRAFTNSSCCLLPDPTIQFNSSLDIEFSSHVLIPDCQSFPVWLTDSTLLCQVECFPDWNHLVALFKIEVHIAHSANEDELPAGDPVLCGVGFVEYRQYNSWQ